MSERNDTPPAITEPDTTVDDPTEDLGVEEEIEGLDEDDDDEDEYGDDFDPSDDEDEDEDGE